MATVKKIADYFGVSAESLLSTDKNADAQIEIPNILKMISPISVKELNLLVSYRTHVEMQPAIDKILGLSDNGTVTLYEAAKSDDNHNPKITVMTKEKWDAIENAPNTDEPLL